MIQKYIYCLFIVFPSLLSAQIVISGKVIDPINRENLAYVNIGIRNKNIGTTSLDDGTFSITLPSIYQNDTLLFSLVGYSEFKLPIQQSVQKLIPLFRKANALNEVIVSTSRLKDKKFGLKKRYAGFHLLDGMHSANDMFEIAQLIKLPARPTKLLSFNLCVNQATTDSVVYRINFYKFDGEHPAERLNEENILRKELLKEGWLSVDLTPYNIYGKNEVVFSIEFFPSPTRKIPIQYEVKIGGSSKSFLRKNSQGEWMTPPHHYLMYVNALVSDDKTFKEEDENERPATKRMYSNFVDDTFSVFVHLPKNYSKNPKQDYPVAYVLDANALFDVVIPDTQDSAIVVGIGYKDAYLMDSLRNRDYTFPTAPKKENWTISGGANKFRNFIQKELIPDIDKNYRTKKNKNILMGHSLGGYFVLYSLLKDVEENNVSINSYISISPSLYYADSYIIRSFNTLMTSKNSMSKNLYSAYGGSEAEGDAAASSIEVNTFNAYIDGLRMHSTIQVKSEIYSSFGHMETVIPGFKKGLNHFLSK